MVGRRCCAAVNLGRGAPLPYPASPNLTRDHRIFIEGIDGAETMITVGDEHAGVGRIPHQQQGREFHARQNLFLILFHVGIGRAQQRQRGGAENILGLERRHGRFLQPADDACRRLDVKDQRQIGQRRRIIVRLRFAQPFNRDFFGHEI